MECKKKVAWNKGKTFSEESRNKMSLAKLGKPSNWVRTEETKEKIRLANIGREVSEETRKKQSNARKGKTPWNKGIKGIIPWNKGKKLSPQHCVNLSKSHLGQVGNWLGKKRPPHVGIAVANANRNKSKEKHWNWQGGVNDLSDSIRKSEKYKQWRMAVYKRDKFTCQICGSPKSIEADHIKPFSIIRKENNIHCIEEALICDELWGTTNGRTLCKICHKKHGWNFFKEQNPRKKSA